MFPVSMSPAASGSACCTSVLGLQCFESLVNDMGRGARHRARAVGDSTLCCVLGGHEVEMVPVWDTLGATDALCAPRT